MAHKGVDKVPPKGVFHRITAHRVVIVVGVVSLLLLSLWVVYLCTLLIGNDNLPFDLPDSFGGLGDAMGLLDGLFSALAVIFALVAVLLQGRELDRGTRLNYCSTMLNYRMQDLQNFTDTIRDFEQRMERFDQGSGVTPHSDIGDVYQPNKIVENMEKVYHFDIENNKILKNAKDETGSVEQAEFKMEPVLESYRKALSAYDRSSPSRQSKLRCKVKIEEYRLYLKATRDEINLILDRSEKLNPDNGRN